MYTFPELLKEIRSASDVTQKELASALSVSTILVSMIEGGQKEVSKNFILRLASKLDVHPSSITPFLFVDDNFRSTKLSNVEKSFIEIGERLQKYLIKHKAKNVKRYVKRSESLS